MFLLVFIWCVVSEEVGKAAIMLEEGGVVAHLRHLSVSEHNDKVRLGQEADAMGYQHPGLWRRQQFLSCSILRQTPSMGTEPWGKHEESVIGQAHPQHIPHQPEPAHLGGVHLYGFPQIVSCFSGSYISRSPCPSPHTTPLPPPVCSPQGPNLTFAPTLWWPHLACQHTFWSNHLVENMFSHMRVHS